MANIRPVFTKFISLLFILIHLGCFIIFPTSDHHRRRSKTTRKPSSPLPLLRPTTIKLKPHKTLSASWSFIKRIFSSKSTTQTDVNSSIIHHVPSPASSTRSLRISTINVDPPHHRIRPGSLTESDFLPLRNDIFPCPDCGEIFQKPGLLEQHQALKHAVSELFDDDPGKNIVQIIFQTGWPGTGKTPMIYRVMKIHNSSKILSRFEEYREIVKSTAARYGGVRRRDERCIADGNELLRFHCATFLCELGQNGNSSICSQPVLQCVWDYPGRVFTKNGWDIHIFNKLEGTRGTTRRHRGGVPVHARETGHARVPGHSRSGWMRSGNRGQG